MLKRQVLQVSAQIWCVRQPSYFCCSYGVKTPEGVVCIDAGMNSDGSDLLALLQAMQVSPSDLKAIFLTHWHNDHAAGAQAIQAQSGCDVYFHAHEDPWLSRAGARTGWQGKVVNFLPEWGIGVLLIGLLGNAIPRPIGATRQIEDGDFILGFEVMETPGHTPGHLSFYYPPEKALFAGDALAVIGNQVRFMARWVTPDQEKARQSMQKCLEKDIRMLCPGHRQPLTVGVEAACEAMRKKIKTEMGWPFWG